MPPREVFMSEDNDVFVYGDTKIIGKVSNGVVYFITLIDNKLPFALVYKKGKTDYSPNQYEIIYEDAYTNHFDECSQIVTSPDGKLIL